MNTDEIMARAMKAYFRRQEGIVSEPPSSLSHVEELNGRTYAVLRNSERTVAVYSVAKTGCLRYLKRYPSILRFPVLFPQSWR